MLRYTVSQVYQRQEEKVSNPALLISFLAAVARHNEDNKTGTVSYLSIFKLQHQFRIISGTGNDSLTTTDIFIRGKAVVSILSKLHKLGNHSFDVFFKLFDAQVQPIVLYSADIWGI